MKTKIKQLGDGWYLEDASSLPWPHRETYRCDFGPGDFLQAIRFEREWVIVRHYPDGGKGAHSLPSFKQVVEYVNIKGV